MEKQQQIQVLTNFGLDRSSYKSLNWYQPGYSK